MIEGHLQSSFGELEVALGWRVSEAGFRSILVTQPRRLAAVSLARRVAAERLDSGQAPVFRSSAPLPSTGGPPKGDSSQRSGFVRAGGKHFRTYFAL